MTKTSARNAKTDCGRHSALALECLRGSMFFSKFADEEIAAFADAAQQRNYPKGKVIYIEGDVADFFYVIRSGWIKLFHTMPEGDEVIVDMLTTGHMAGEGAVFEHGLHTSSAQVIEEVHMISVPTRILKEQICRSPVLALGMIEAMFLHHRRHYDAIALNATQSAPQRIGCFLLRLCPRNREKGAAFALPYDKTLIADTLGMNGATFSRALNLLRRETNIHINGNHIRIDSIELLMRFVYGPLAEKFIPKDM